MKRVFKLIKQYPDSQTEVGYEAVFEEGIEVITKFIDDCKLWKVEYDLNELQKYPEFWKEVKQKDYEILNLIGKKQLRILRILNSKTNLYKHATVGDTEELTLEYLLTSGYEIHSVKRLSDGEIFTIGDKIHGHKLEKIFIAPSNKNDLVLSCKGLKRALYLIEDKHLKIDSKPLFITEDSVDIFEGDEYYSVFPLKDFTYKNFYGSKAGNIKDDRVVRFSTKEKAEEYILMNKPCLSINDVMNAGYGICNPESLIKIAKQKSDGNK